MELDKIMITAFWILKLSNNNKNDDDDNNNNNNNNNKWWSKLLHALNIYKFILFLKYV
jgi:hypothetical protein